MTAYIPSGLAVQVATQAPEKYNKTFCIFVIRHCISSLPSTC